MTGFIFAHPHPFYDLSITLSIYDNWNQIARRAFSLRNLTGQTEEEHLAHAQQIMNEVATELHYITNLGIDKGIIKIGKKKAEEILYPDLRPHDKVQYFRLGINIGFFPVFNYLWVSGNRRTARIPTGMIEEGIECQKVEWRKRASFRLPVHAAYPQTKETLFFRHYGNIKRGRKVIGWAPYYKKQDEIFSRFIERFYDDGNLCFGEDRYWGKPMNNIDISGTFWKVPERPNAQISRRTQIASQPTDNTDYVYLIRMGRTKMYKIGKTNDPKGRLANLQTASPYKLKLLHTFKADNASAAEESLHAELQGVRQEGEWFKLSDDQRGILMAVTEYRDYHFIVNGESLTVGELFVNG